MDLKRGNEIVLNSSRRIGKGKKDVIHKNQQSLPLTDNEE